MSDVNKIFQEFLSKNLDQENIDFQSLFKAHTELRESLEKKINAYKKVMGVLQEDKPQPESSLVGREIGGCDLNKILGQGGMGVVYLGRQKKLNRDVVVKVLRPFAVDNQALKERFLRESRIIGRLNHKNIVPVYDVGEQDGSFYTIMQHVAGLSVSDLIKKLEKIDRSSLKMDDLSSLLPDPSWGSALLHLKTPTEFFCHLIIQVADAIQYAHNNGVIHRDIKPSNIIVAPDGIPILLDFGLSHDEIENNLTVSGEFLGTPIYSAPELFTKTGSKNLHQLDVYALGVTLYELLTGALPYEGKSIYEIYSSIKNDEPVRPKKRWIGIPSDLETIVSTAISKVSTFRYQSISSLREDLYHFLRYQPITAKSPSSIQRILYFARRKTALVVTFAALIFVAGSIAAGTIYYKKQQVLEAKRTTLSLMQKGDYDQNLKKLEEVTSHFPDDPDGWYYLGILKGNAGRYDEAIEHLRKSLKIKDSIPIRISLAGILFQNAEIASARSE